MDDRKAQAMIQHAVDVTLSGLQGNPYRAQLVLRATQPQKEKRAMRKGFSLALVVVLALVLTSVTALAMGLTNYFSGFKALESRYGDIEDWPVDAQIRLVDLMLDSGVLSPEDVPGWAGSQGAEKEAAAQAAVEAYFGDMIFIDTYNIMARLLGPIEQWTEEQRALYTDLLVAYGEQKDDSPYYMVPTGNDLTREQAVRRAKEYLASTFALTPEDYDGLPVEAYFFAASYNEEGLPADEPYWSISIGNGEAWRYVHMTRTGELLSMSEPEE